MLNQQAMSLSLARFPKIKIESFARLETLRQPSCSRPNLTSHSGPINILPSRKQPQSQSIRLAIKSKSSSSLLAIRPLCSGFDEDGESPQRVHEERRLTYVGMTRAKERLLLSYVMSGPDGQPQSASRFLGEVAGGLLVRTQHYELLSEAGRASG